MIFKDQASNRWRADIVETPQPAKIRVDRDGDRMQISPRVHAVIVKAFDSSGNLAASAKTALLRGANPYSLPGGGWVGGVQAFELSQLLGTDLTPNPGSSEFRGTVTVEGDMRAGRSLPLCGRINLALDGVGGGDAGIAAIKRIIGD